MSWKDNRRANLTIQAIANILDTNGIDLTECFGDTAIDIKQILNADVDIPNQTEIEVIERAVEVLPKQAGYGVKAAQALDVTNFGVLGLAILTSPTVRSALEAMASFSEVSILLSRVSFRESLGRVAFILDMEHLPVAIHRFTFERYFYMTLRFLREMSPDYDASDFELQLPFSDPHYEQELAEISGLKVRSNQPFYALIASKELLDLPVTNTDPIAHNHFLSECQRILNETNKFAGFAQKVRNYILQEKNFSPKLTDVANSLFISDRTLKRRLQEENHNFKAVVMDTKMTLARELLLAASLPVKVVATRLDYSESASFLRAFKKWWGVSPAQMRAAQSQPLAKDSEVQH
ncbi:AraC family transcriptional regulator [Thalassotalea euphylliae]|uniref:AraC family transcriptional regulator n=1 Tax=Thalassotalea euphylliae TaxID=1655234 RepID=A0A3E0TN89_9GAMM|nr:AraC family transcriptional regulator [Thalassotalea euphylliae]REL25883.1 AraC family transcriptional regulator [Thalassotalea euphylliae]